MPYPRNPSYRTRPAISAGELAHKLATNIANFVEGTGGVSFSRICDVRGAVAAALNEFERRVVEPYEQSKIEGGGADPYAALEADVHEQLSAARAGRVQEELRRG